MREIIDESAALESTTVGVYRTAATVKGGRRFSFAALVVVGDRAGHIGVGYGKAKEVPAAIQKAFELARKDMFAVPMAGESIIHEIISEQGASRVLLKPAAPGTGVIAGGAVRQILEAAGIHNVLAKSLGSPTHINVAKATIKALSELKNPTEEIARRRARPSAEEVPSGGQA